MFSGLSPLVVEDVVDEGERILVRARTPRGQAARPGCGVPSGRVHGYHERTVADLPVDGAGRAASAAGPAPGVLSHLPEQVPGVLERYQRRTPPAGWSDDSGVLKQDTAGAPQTWAGPTGRDRRLVIEATVPLPAVGSGSAEGTRSSETGAH